LEPGQYKSIADALAAAEAGDTVVLGPGHHWEGDLSSDKAVRILGEATDPARVLIEMTGSVRWTARKGLVVGVSLRRPRPCPDKGPLIKVDSGGNLQLSACHVNNKQAGEASPGLEVTDANSILFLERCRVQDARGDGVSCGSGGSVAVVGCEISGSGGAGVLVR
ncbi:unnamed protein product, partial [Ectocarpus fasciculatus]